MNKHTRAFLVDLLATMKELKDDENREQFCIEFDKNYEKLKKKLEVQDDK